MLRNPFHQKVLLVYCIAVVAACVMVPWQAGTAGIFQGYWFIWESPRTDFSPMRVAYLRVGLTIFMLTALVAGVMLSHEIWKARR